MYLSDGCSALLLRHPEGLGAATEDHLQRVPAATDARWQLNGYAFIRCDCGTQIKVPPAYKGQTIGCPHCGRPHMVGG